MAENSRDSERIAIIRSYFRKIDERDPSFFDDVAEDVQLFFPKFGIGHGKAALALFGERLGSDLESLSHDIDGFNVIVAGDTIVVEGQESGVTRAGLRWPDGVVSEGRFCNVFEFDGLKIRRIHIYVDPDFTNSHDERVRLLRGGKTPGDETRGVVNRYFMMMLTGAEPEAIASLFSEAIDWDIAGDTTLVPWIGRKTGRAGVASFVQDLRERIEPVSFEVSSILVDGKRAVAMGALVSKVTNTGKTIETEFALDFTVEAGLITRYRMLEDSFAVARAAA
ncbi:nuclear transport factor 2 family protein [Phreatobacter stygius]|uniref:SnoaL-like domain-containing protein n=1 Tax=Phreatobacter stygius TaxID=1940610 RepID=A0A4D7B2G2_9HYPH|nr:nuclear transport factor 2 family protein [Phreatobacter stygius]QCI67031.1 hypothetical protein E8M01_23955 [Phreatobacter stygius]